jgi:type II secretory pathway pseudopilin PulG
LTVISIIGLLITLLLPAVQAARDAARRVQCQNNLKQISLACLTHETSQKHLPAGGWGYSYTGDPDRGFDAKQPGGWIYNILPYLEQGNIRQIGVGLSGPKPGGAKYKALASLRATPIALFYCPSRRAAEIYPLAQESLNAALPVLAAKTDYAGNGGSNPIANAGPSIDCLDTFPNCNFETDDAQIASSFDGVFTERSTMELRQIIDGLSNTLLVAEKHLAPINYETGRDPGDDDSMYVGNDLDIVRWTGSDPERLPMEDKYLPTPSRPGRISLIFGSAHSGVFQAAFCDGRVQPLSYSIDPKTYLALGTRGGREVSSLPEP